MAEIASPHQQVTIVDSPGPRRRALKAVLELLTGETVDELPAADSTTFREFQSQLREALRSSSIVMLHAHARLDGVSPSEPNPGLLLFCSVVHAESDCCRVIVTSHHPRQYFDDTCYSGVLASDSVSYVTIPLGTIGLFKALTMRSETRSSSPS